MRLRPRSIAGRMSVVLGLGVVLLLLVTMVLSSLAFLGQPGPPRPFGMIERIAAAAIAVDRVPVEGRGDIAAALSEGDLTMSWHRQFPLQTLRPGGWAAGHMERHLGRALGEAGLGPVVVGRDPIAGIGDGRVPLVTWLRLGDGSWLQITMGDGDEAGSRALHVLVAFLVFAIGLALLASWIARWATAPLAGFADAATRLGDDVQAAPLPESGPREIEHAARAFNRMQARIRRMIDDRTLMLAALSHDLRTPLTRMRLRAEFVEDEQARAKMLADLAAMEAMIGDTLAMLRAEADNEPASPVDLAELLRDLVAEEADDRRPLALDAPKQLHVRGRPVALARALRNLVQNAQAYGGGARVRLTAEADRALITIDDDGPGIPEDELARVFAPFHRLETSRSRTTGGSGLGLAVAQSVIRVHGGEITLANRAGGGLRQTVSLPRAA